MTDYKAEYRALKALNGKLHANIWRLTQEHMTDTRNNAINAIRKEIEANQRRMNTIEYLIHWLRDV